MVSMMPAGHAHRWGAIHLVHLPSAAATLGLDDGPTPSDVQSRAKRWVHDEDAQRYLRSQRALQLVFSSHGLSRLALRNPRVALNGKPFHDDAPPFNMSRREAWAAYVVAHDAGPVDGMGAPGEVGIDVEPLRPIEHFEDLLRTHFTEKERAALPVPANEVDRLRHFLRGWTRKEAVIKAIGSGLSVEPATFETGLLAELTQVYVSTPFWRYVVEVDSLDEEVTVANHPGLPSPQTVLVAVARVVSRSKP
jgi:4'-phosphopantetheinyl transferase